MVQCVAQLLRIRVSMPKAGWTSRSTEDSKVVPGETYQPNYLVELCGTMDWFGYETLKSQENLTNRALRDVSASAHIL